MISETSTLRAMARFLGEWNWCQSRSWAKARSFSTRVSEFLSSGFMVDTNLPLHGRLLFRDDHIGGQSHGDQVVAVGADRDLAQGGAGAFLDDAGFGLEGAAGGR